MLTNLASPKGLIGFSNAFVVFLRLYFLRGLPSTTRKRTMTTVGYQNRASQASLRHPIPGGARFDNSRRETAKGIIFSATLHIIIALTGLLFLKSRPTTSATVATRLYDIEVVPLSAFETNLPKGSIPPKAAENPPPLDTQRLAAKMRPAIASPSVAQSSSAKNESAYARPPSLTETQATLGIPQGDATNLERARINYQDMVASLLARAKRYPERALRRRMTGNGTIRIEITADGSISEFAILQSTESPILDEELRALVDRAAPFPAFPSDLRKQSLALVVPITFRLDG
jgi:TonB family protein